MTKVVSAVTCLWLLVSLPCFSKDVEVGGAIIRIVPPNGYVELTADDDKALFDLFRQFVAPTNVEYAHFISNEDFERVREGEKAAFARRLSVQVLRTEQDLDLTIGKFKKLKSDQRRELSEISTVLKEANKYVGEQFESLESEFDVNIGFDGMKMSALPVHLENDRALAFSTKVESTMNDERGTPITYTGMVTTTLVELNGRAMLLYAFGAEGDLEWTRAASVKWMNEMMLANPSRQLDGWFFDSWSERSKNALLAAIVGGLLALIGGWISDRRRRKSVK